MTYALQLKIQTVGKVADLSLKSASQQDRYQVINLLASLVNVKVEEMNLTISNTSDHGCKCSPVSQKVSKVLETEQKVTEKSVATRKLPMIDSNRSQMVSFGEKLQEAIQQKEKEPEFYKTGIKIDEDGTKRYKCRYTCNCGQKGNHYIPLKTTEVNCFKCEQPLQVSLAAGEVDALRIPVRDSFGNYYIAE